VKKWLISVWQEWWSVIITVTASALALILAVCFLSVSNTTCREACQKSGWGTGEKLQDSKMCMCVNFDKPGPAAYMTLKEDKK